jgi:hypothetical protein
MNTQKRSGRAFLAGGVIAVLGALTTGSPGAAQEGVLIAAAPPMNALSVEPRVPRLGITPCVVELFQDVNTGPEYHGDPMTEPEFEYRPPAGCPGPWAKVIFSVELSGPGTTRIANVTFGLGNASLHAGSSVELMVVGAQFHAGQQRWRVERDITEYSALLREARPGYARDTDYFYRDPYWGDNPIASGRMIFYPATAAQPAPEVPDVILPAPRFSDLPRNIERAYLDVYAQLPETWFSCVPADAVAQWPLLRETPLAIGDMDYTYEPDWQGCSGSTYRDVLVRIDGEVVGAAPLYPWLKSDLNRRFERSVDVPVPTPQSINLMPHRIDLTPYAALLSNGTPHEILLEYASAEGMYIGYFHSGQLLLYLDRGSTQVTGSVTRNTLNSVPVEVTTMRNDWTVGDNATLTGDVERIYRRKYEIAGYVNTSRGRVDTTVKQEQVISNTQHVVLVGYDNYTDHEYRQNLDLVSITERTSLRQRGTKVLAFDQLRYHYPLKIDYSANGGTRGNYPAIINWAQAMVTQGHHQQRSHYRPAGTYADRIYANFVGSRAFDALTGISSAWYGARSHYFTDSAGSCSRERVTWQRDALTSHTQGTGCPDGINRVRGFAHPDGSPDNLGWLR